LILFEDKEREMKNAFKIAILTIAAMTCAVLIYKLVFIRVVNYEIAGISIPSKYNIVTGKVTPLADYKGKAPRTTVESHKANSLGLSDEQVALAQVKWALFEQWANSRPKYKGWDKDREIFKKANDEFRKQLKAG